MMNTFPRYEHDCESCYFLGQHEDADLYACCMGKTATVIARTSDEGSDYTSGIAGALNGDAALLEALRIAHQRGLIGLVGRQSTFGFVPPSELLVMGRALRNKSVTA